MLYYLSQSFLTDHHPLANLLRYITFRSLAAGVFSFLFVVYLMPKLMALLQQRSIRQVVRDDGPKTHYSKAGTPTMGGILMVLGIAFSSLLFCRLHLPFVWISLFVLLSFGAIGFFDDTLKLTKKNSKGIHPRFKFLSLGIISLIAIYWALSSAGISTVVKFPFFKSLSVDIGPFFFLWGFLVINGTSNSVNLTDGLDGLAIVPVMTTAFVLLITSYVTGHYTFAKYLFLDFFPGAGELTVMLSSMIGVGLGFLWFNAHPAEVFMGDVGSLALGGLLGIVALLTHKEWVLFLAGFLFVLEALSVIIQVAYFKSTKKRIFRMSPLHHHFELGGWPESKVIVRFWILSVLFALLALSTLKIR